MNKLITFKPWYVLVYLLCFSNYLASQTTNYVPNELLVKFKSEVASSKQVKILQSLNANVLDKFENLSIQQWHVPDSPSYDGQTFNDLEELAAYLTANNTHIEFAEPNYYVHNAFIPNDTYFSVQWGLHNTGQDGGTPEADINAVNAWQHLQDQNLPIGTKDVVVAIIDSGVDWTHPDLVNNIWQNLGEDADGDGVVLIQEDGVWKLDPDDLDGVDNDNNGYVDDFMGWDFVENDSIPNDPNGHGTLVAGIIGASGNNAIGIAGVCHQVRIMPLRVLNEEGVGLVSDVINALDYAISKKIYLSNNSWGSLDMSETLRLKIEEAATVNHLFITAAGNDAMDNDVTPYYPASFDLDNIIAVAATDEHDELATFSNYGASSVDIAAPGVEILSTKPMDEYGGANGTSMATSFVTGAAALLWSLETDADYTEIKEAILNSVDVLDNLSGVVATSGRLDLHNAILAMASAGATCPWKITDSETECNASSFKICIEAVAPLEKAMAVSFSIQYPEGVELVPGGSFSYFRLEPDLVEDLSDWLSYGHPDLINRSLNVVVGSNTFPFATLNGVGTLGCSEFQFVDELHNTWSENDFSINYFYEDYENPLETITVCAEDGLLKVGFNPGHELTFWVRGDESRPLTEKDSNSPITHIVTADDDCNPSGDENAVLDENGTTVIGPTNYFHAARWIGHCDNNTTSVINAQDALEAARIATRVPNNDISIYELVAADVTGDGKVTAGDASQILVRRVEGLCYFLPKSGEDTSDWKFERYEVVLQDNAWQICPDYPGGTGDCANADNVPVVSQCLPTPEISGEDCGYSYSNYVAVLKGDVTDSWKQEYNFLKTAKNMGKLVIDLNTVHSHPSTSDKYLIPIYYSGTEDVQSMDMDFKFEGVKLNIEEVIVASEYNGLEMTWKVHDDNILSISAYSLDHKFSIGKPILYLVTSTNPHKISADYFDINTAQVLLKGQPANIAIIDAEVTTDIDAIHSDFSIYPNPTDKVLQVRFEGNQAMEAITYAVFDYTGKLLHQNSVEKSSNTSFQINTANYPPGGYLFAIHSTETGKLLAREKIVIVH